jgi:hypothetical protein
MSLLEAAMRSLQWIRSVWYDEMKSCDGMGRASMGGDMWVLLWYITSNEPFRGLR